MVVEVRVRVVEVKGMVVEAMAKAEEGRVRVVAAMVGGETRPSSRSPT
jgi:hypothetical protein